MAVVVVVAVAVAVAGVVAVAVAVAVVVVVAAVAVAVVIGYNWICHRACGFDSFRCLSPKEEKANGMLSATIW